MRRICGALHQCAEPGDSQPKHCRHTLRAPRSGPTDSRNPIHLREEGRTADLEGDYTDRNDHLHFNDNNYDDDHDNYDGSTHHFHDNVNIDDHHHNYDGPSSLGG